MRGLGRISVLGGVGVASVLRGVSAASSPGLGGGAGVGVGVGGVLEGSWFRMRPRSAKYHA